MFGSEKKPTIDIRASSSCLQDFIARVIFGGESKTLHVKSNSSVDCEKELMSIYSQFGPTEVQVLPERDCQFKV